VPLGIHIDRQWLQYDTQFDYQYVPQIGDTVIYFPQGHIELLNHFPENRPPPWLQFSNKWPVVECKVENITYDFPTQIEYNRCFSVVASLTLLITRIPLRRYSQHGQIVTEFVVPRATRNNTNPYQTFEVTMRDFSTPDFLVPVHLYERAMHGNFNNNTNT
jgi:hypothetical protein